MRNNPIVIDEQLEVSGFKGPNRANRFLRGLKTKQEARKAINKMYSNLPRQERRRLDYYRFEVSIRCALNNFLLSHNRLPTVLELEYETGISRTTIYKHLKDDFQGFEKEFEMKISKLRQLAIERLYIIGVDDCNVSALKEFLKLTCKEKHPTKDDKLIQINNIYIDQRTIQNLPDNTKQQLEILLLESAKVDKG